jgi:hypothetical protein
MSRTNPGFVRLTRDNCPDEFPEQLRKNNHLGDEIWFKERTAAEKSEVIVRNFSDMIALDPGANKYLTGITPSHVVICSPRLHEQIKSWNKEIGIYQSARDTRINSKESVIVSNFNIKSLEYRLARDIDVYEELEEARRAHVDLLQKELDDDEIAVQLTRRISVVYKRIERRVDRCHKHVNWFLSKFKYVLYPSFRADQEMLSRKKKNPLAKGVKSVLSWMAHARQRRKLCHLMTLCGGVLVDASESCSTMLGSCCGTISSPGMGSANTPGKCQVHHCPNEKCKAKLVRDESGWAIFVFAVARILLVLKEKREKIEETYMNRRIDSTQPLAKGSLAQGEFVPNLLSR